MTQQVQQGVAVRSAPLQWPSCWCRPPRNRSRIFRRSQQHHEDRKGVNQWQMELLPDMQMKREVSWQGLKRLCTQRGSCCEVTN